jgi:biotin carboxylase
MKQKVAENIKKKLLILGANVETIPLIKTAQQKGVYVIVTDYNPEAPAKKVADKSFNVDCLDINGLVNLCKSEKIDGVMLGVADSLVKAYQQLCERLNYVCYLTKEQSEVFSNKLLFNQYCSKYGLNVIPNYEVNLSDFEITSKVVEYPLFVKPIDGNSGKGASICETEEELRRGIIKAKSVSRTGQYLVEKYMKCDDTLIYFTFQNGNILLSAMGERFTIEQGKNGSRVCVGAIYPSKYINLYFETVHDKLVKMFNEINIQNGILLISAFVENKKFYLYDPGFRLQGEAPDIHIAKALGYDQKEALVNFSLSGYMKASEVLERHNIDFNGKIHITIWIFAKEGKINTVKGVSELDSHPNVFYYLQRLFEGDVINRKDV